MFSGDCRKYYLFGNRSGATTSFGGKEITKQPRIEVTFSQADIFGTKNSNPNVRMVNDEQLLKYGVSKVRISLICSGKLECQGSQINKLVYVNKFGEYCLNSFISERKVKHLVLRRNLFVWFPKVKGTWM